MALKRITGYKTKQRQKKKRVDSFVAVVAVRVVERCGVGLAAIGGFRTRRRPDDESSAQGSQRPLQKFAACGRRRLTLHGAKIIRSIRLWPAGNRGLRNFSEGAAPSTGQGD